MAQYEQDSKFESKGARQLSQKKRPRNKESANAWTERQSRKGRKRAINKMREQESWSEVFDDA